MRNMLGIKKLSVVLLTAMVLMSGLVMLLEPTNQTEMSDQGSTTQSLGGEHDFPGTFESDEHTILLYHFDETSGSIAEDETGSYDGTILGEPEWVPGRWGNALEFDGIDNYVDTGWYPHIPAEGDFTVECWIKTDNTERYYGMPLFGVNDATYDHHPRLWCTMVSRAHNMYPYFGAEYCDESEHGNSLGASEVIDDDIWHHIAFMKNDGMLELYLDGILLNSVPDNSDDEYIADYSFRVGDDRFYPVANYEGLMDEFRVSNIARDIQPLIGVKTDKDSYAPGEEVVITADYFESSDGLTLEVISPEGETIHTVTDRTVWGMPYVSDENTVALYHLDEADVVSDYSGNENIGTIFGADSTNGQLSSALDFDGISDYVSVEHDESLNFGDGDFTVEMWVNSLIPTTTYDPLVIKYPGANGDPACFLTQIGDHSLRTGMFEIIIRNSQNVYVFVQSTTPVNDGKWHHCAAVREDDELRIYVDGKLENTIDCSIVGDISNSAPLWMGKRITFDHFYDGSLDEVRLSNKARDIAEFNVRHYLQTSFTLPVDADSGEYTVVVTDSEYQVSSSVAFDVGGVPVLCDLSIDTESITFSNEEPYAQETVTITAIVEDLTAITPGLKTVQLGLISDGEHDNAQGIVSGDIDEDGDMDVVAATYDQGNRLFILENDGSTEDSWESHLIGSAYGYINGIDLADFDGDGDLDILTCDWGGRILLWNNVNSETMTFNGPYFIGSAGAVANIATGDLDKDGDIDIISTLYEHSIKVWENPGNPWGSWNGWIAGTTDRATRSIILTDLDNDGWTDFVVGHSWPAGLVTVWQNDGTPWGTWNHYDVFRGGRIENIAVADLDGDGYDDIIAPEHTDYGYVHIWKNDQSPFDKGWSTTTIGATGVKTDGILVADFDNDGCLDILTGDYSTSLHVWRWSDDPFSGSWVSEEFATGAGVVTMAESDINGDSIPDAVIRCFGQNLCVYGFTLDTTNTYEYSEATVEFRLGSETGSLIHTETVTIPLGGEVTVSSTWTPVNSGDTEIFVVVTDIIPNDQDTNNNVASRTLHVQERPAFWVVDDNDGPWAHFNSISDAVDFAVAGETIRVFTGEYSENVIVNKQLSIIGNGSSETIIDGNGCEDVVIITAHSVEVSGFKITNSASNPDDAGIELQSDHNIIKECDVSGNGYYGIYLYQSSNNTISNNICSFNAYEGIIVHGDGIDCWNNIVSNNTCNQNGRSGIWTRYSWNTLIENNTCDNNAEHGIGISTRGNRTIVYRNTIMNNEANGIYLHNQQRNNVVSYNTISSNSGYGIYIFHPKAGWPPAKENVIHHNIVINNGGTSSQGYDGGIDNTWDDGSEGNWWSDYDGPDADGDGIGDIPYDLEGEEEGSDNYPLMGYGPYSFKTIEYRLAGKPGNIVSLSVTLDGIETDITSLMRTTGAPDVTSFRFYIDNRATIDLTFQFTACEGNTDTPIWIIIDGKKEKMTTFEATDDLDTWYQEYQIPQDLID